MSAAYYDLYGEEGALFVVKLNILDKDGKSVNLDKTATDTAGNLIPLYIPEELKAVGVGQVTDIKATLSLKSNLFDEEPLMLFTTDSSVYANNDTIGRILLKKGSQFDRNLDHNVILHRKMTQSLIISGIPTALELVDGGVGISDMNVTLIDKKGTQIKVTVGRLYNNEAPVQSYTQEKPYPYPKYAGNAGSDRVSHCSGTITSATIIKSNSSYNDEELITFKSVSPDINELYGASNAGNAEIKTLLKNIKIGTISPGKYQCGVLEQPSSIQTYWAFKIATPYCSNIGVTPVSNPPFDDTCSVPFTSAATTSSYGVLGVSYDSSTDTMVSVPYTQTQRYVPMYPFRWTKPDGSKKIPATGAWADVELRVGDKIKFPAVYTTYVHTDKGPNGDLPLNRQDFPLDCAGFDPTTGRCPDPVWLLMTVDDIDFPKASFPCFDSNGNITSGCLGGRIPDPTNPGSTIPTWKFDNTTAQIKGYVNILYKVDDGYGGKIDKIAPLHTSRWTIYNGEAQYDYKLKYGQDSDTGECIKQCSRDFFWASPNCQTALKPKTAVGTHNCGKLVGIGQIVNKTSVDGASGFTQDGVSNSMPTVYDLDDTGRHNKIIGQMYQKYDVGSTSSTAGCLSATAAPQLPSDIRVPTAECSLNFRSYFNLSCDANNSYIDRYAAVPGERIVDPKCWNWKYKDIEQTPTASFRGDYLTKITDNGCGCLVQSFMSDEAKKSKVPDLTFDVTGADNDLIRFRSPVFKVSEVKSTNHSVLGTHFYDLEFTFTTKISPTSTETVDYTLRMIQGKFVITPEVTKT